jgi:hypothetical protein
MRKLTWTAIGWQHPLVIIILTVVGTASITYSVVNNLIVEHYRLEIQRLEKILVQQSKINDLDSIARTLRTLLKEQVTSIDSQRPQGHGSPRPARWDLALRAKVLSGADLLKMSPADNRTFDVFRSWRIESQALLTDIDSELKTEYEKSFMTLTKIDISDYPQLRDKITDGLSVLKLILLRKEREK